MADIALLAITGITILNSVSIILLAVHAKKVDAENRKYEEQTKHSIEDLNRVRKEENVGVEIRALQEDLKELHMEISAVKHIPISKKYAMTRTFLKRRRWWIAEAEEKRDYVAEVALKTIASELPEEERTPEMIEGIIIPVIRKKLNKSSMKL